MQAYWHRYDTLIDYTLFDYVFDYAYSENIGGFRDEVDGLALCGRGTWKLLAHLNDPNDGDWRDAEWANDTSVFKLTYVDEVLRAHLGGRLPRETGASGETIYGSIRSTLDPGLWQTVRAEP